MISSEPTNEVPKPPLPMESKKVDTNMPIIVNTLNGETDMIISRRSTYQKILAMEKEGIQVVERDLNLPVDVIISAASCLVLYDINNIRKKTNSLDGASSLPSCIENIAANVLTSLSFSLSSCILVSIFLKSCLSNINQQFLFSVNYRFHPLCIYPITE